MSQTADARSVVLSMKTGAEVHAGYIVTLSAANTVIEASDSGAAAFAHGVCLDNEATVGNPVRVVVLGPAKIWCDATTPITAGCAIGSDSGVGVVVDTDKYHIVGRALEALASGTGWVSCIVNPQAMAK
jgi:hypothetical protein